MSEYLKCYRLEIPDSAYKYLIFYLKRPSFVELEGVLLTVPNSFGLHIADYVDRLVLCTGNTITWANTQL